MLHMYLRLLTVDARFSGTVPSRRIFIGGHHARGAADLHAVIMAHVALQTDAPDAVPAEASCHFRSRAVHCSPIIWIKVHVLASDRFHSAAVLQCNLIALFP